MSSFFKIFLHYIIKFSTYFKIGTILTLIALFLAYICPVIHPASVWFLPFFGLAYPISMLFALFFLICWSLVWSRWALIMLCGIIAGGTLHFRSIGTVFNPVEIPSDINSIKVLSFNCQLMGLYEPKVSDRIFRRNKILNYMQGEQPDVMCLQEFYHQDRPTTFLTRDTIIRCLKMRNYQERYSHKLVGRQNFGIALFSKYPIIQKGDVMFDNQIMSSDNYCVFADIVKQKDTFRVYNIHLQSIKFQKQEYAMFGEKEIHSPNSKDVSSLVKKLKDAYQARGDQANRVINHASTSPYPVIFCGDFNDTPMSYCYNLFNKNYTDAFRNSSSGLGITYAGKVPAGRIDYIFHSKTLSSTKFQIQKEQMSDHYAINCVIWKTKQASQN
jgi:endonuclease/exonuclease/phosphatase family metal-dependent hydrolase